MAGIRIGGSGVIEVISPPFSDYQLSDGSIEVWRKRRGTPAGTATSYTDYVDGGTFITDIFNPVLSPDGTQIAFAGRLDATGLTAIFVVDNVPLSTATMLEDDATFNLNTPMWSPDGTTLVYTRSNGAGGSTYGGDIESIPAAGGSPTVLWTAPAGYRAFRPAYSFDGDFIAFNATEISGPDDGLWVMEANGANDAEIDGPVAYNGDGPQFGWANSSLTIAYDDGNGALGSSPREVYVINHDGTGKTTISVGVTSGAPNRCSDRCWVADDSAVIISSNQGGGAGFEAYSLDPGGGGETSLNSTHGAVNQSWCRQMYVYRNRIWFIELASAANTGVISSMAMDGTDYVEELDVTDDTELDWFGSGTGFVFQ